MQNLKLVIVFILVILVSACKEEEIIDGNLELCGKVWFEHPITGLKSLAADALLEIRTDKEFYQFQAINGLYNSSPIFKRTKDDEKISLIISYKIPFPNDNSIIVKETQHIAISDDCLEDITLKSIVQPGLLIFKISSTELELDQIKDVKIYLYDNLDILKSDVNNSQSIRNTTTDEYGTALFFNLIENRNYYIKALTTLDQKEYNNLNILDTTYPVNNENFAVHQVDLIKKNVPSKPQLELEILDSNNQKLESAEVCLFDNRFLMESSRPGCKNELHKEYADSSGVVIFKGLDEKRYYFNIIALKNNINGIDTLTNYNQVDFVDISNSRKLVITVD